MSKEKNTAAEENKGMSREEKRLHDEQVSRRNTIIYTAIGVVVALLVAALLIWDSGVFQRRAAAVSIDGEKYTAADVLYYYSGQYQSAYQYAAYGLNDFDMTKDPKDQVYDEESGQTWHDHFLEQALESLKTYVTVEKEAKEDGYTMSQEMKDSITAYKQSMESSLLTSGYSDMKSYLKTAFGAMMTEKDFDRCLEREVYVNDYMNTLQDGYTYTQEQLEEYYKEHADQLDTITFDQIAFRAYVATTDDDGNTIEMTDEEKAEKLEQAKQEMKAAAEQFKARLEAGEELEALTEEFADQIYTSQIDTGRTSASLNASLSDWYLDGSRKTGDITLGEYDGTTSYIYYVARFLGRERDETPTANVRHILFSASDDEAMANAKTQAEALLDSWKNGEATEDSFAELAKENSADSTASNGGLIEGITPNSSYVESFRDWATDTAHQNGDSGIVESEYGVHVMFFSSWGEPQWKLTTENTLRSNDMTAWLDELLEGITVEQESAIEYVTAT